MLRPWAFRAGGRSAGARSWVEGMTEAVWNWVSPGPGPEIAAGPIGLQGAPLLLGLLTLEQEGDVGRATKESRGLIPLAP